MRIGLIGAGRIGNFHGATLRKVDGVSSIVVADVDPDRAKQLAKELGAEPAESIEALFRAPVEAVVITAVTSAHADLIHRTLDAELPVFCEKPVALDISGTRKVVARAARSTAPVQVGFQRRFDRGYYAAREALRSGELGWIHTLRAVTADAIPPPAEYIPTSGGLFRDCSIHDFDVMRWLTGREVVSVQAMGANRGERFFRDGGDVDTCATVLRFDDDVLATVSATRYNGAGHDVRLEVCGSAGARFVGINGRAPMPTAEENVTWQQDTPYATFMERFHDAYVAELTRFVEVAAGQAGNPCTPADALEALYVAEACDLSYRQGRPVELTEVRADG